MLSAFFPVPLSLSEVFLLALVLASLATAVGYWELFLKAERAGWESMVPGHNLVALMLIVGRPWWWALGFVPGPALGLWAAHGEEPWRWLLAAPGLLLLARVHWQVSHDLAKSFGRSRRTGRRVALLPFVYAALLGAGFSEYVGPAGHKAGRARRRAAAQGG